MKILFVLRHALYLRNYESTIRHWAEQGHGVTLGFASTIDKPGIDEKQLARQLVADYPSIEIRDLPHRNDRWWATIDQVRRLRSLLRYDEPVYRQAHGLRARAAKRVFPPLRWLRSAVARRPRARRLLNGILVAIERAVPSCRAIDDVLRELAADVVALTPLVDFSSRTLDYLKSARRLGIPNVLLVASWDNLTNKGLIHIAPDRTIVWNEAQKREAIELHGIAARRVVVTGAQLFDEWFARRPSTSPQEFGARVGLDTSRPYLLYLCSSGYIAPHEVDFVREWLRALRRHPPTRDLGVLIRPHPANARDWQTADLSEFTQVAVWPREGAHPIADDTKADYFDSIFHARACVAINTSAMIEAGIIGRRSFTVVTSTETQLGTLHFHLLVEGGLLVTAQSIDEQLEQLSRLLHGTAYPIAEIERFIASFVRPHGIDRPCTPIVAQAVLDVATDRVAQPARERTAVDRIAAALLLPLAMGSRVAYSMWRARRRLQRAG